jgi:predicted phosphodiesterase
MTKICLLTDTHYGIRNDALVFIDYQKRFLDDIFFPELEKHQIKDIIHLGDLVDRRKYVNFYTSYRMRQDFLNRLEGYNFHLIAGNHDVFHKNTNDINAFDELLKAYPFHIYKHQAEQVNIAGTDMMMVPWINKQNHEASLKAIAESTAQLCFGHLELVGFEMGRGVVCDHGYDKALFSKFDMTFTGHFHHKSSKDGVYYLGAPYPMTWADYGSAKGFHIFDTETRKLTFIENPYKLFNRIVYDDSGIKSIRNYLKVRPVDPSNVTDCYCKIVVQAKNDPYVFDMFIDHIEKMSPFDLKIVQQSSIISDDDNITDQCEDTLTIINKSIDRLESEQIDRKKLKGFFEQLYKSALELEV